MAAITNLDAATAAARRAEKVEATLAVLNEAVASITTGPDWSRYLSFQAALHDYSANNVLLIATQHTARYETGLVATPLPSYVASYRRWQEFDRHVTKGQTGLAIIAPMRGTRRDAVDADGTVLRRLGKNETVRAGEREVRTDIMQGFTVEKVFSEQQTSGAPIPARTEPRLLAGEAPPGLGAAVLTLIQSQGYSVSIVPDASTIGGANGLTRFREKSVSVRADMDHAAIVKTLIHEAAHVLLHQPPGPHDPPRISRAHAEVEAESVAFVVASVHGMATDDYSFPYVAAWAGEEDPRSVLRATAHRIATTARTIITASPAEHAPGGKAALTLTPAPRPAATPVLDQAPLSRASM